MLKDTRLGARPRVGPPGRVPAAVGSERDRRNEARAVIGTRLAGCPPTAAQVAAVLGLSQRTLQRRLSAEGTTYSALLDDVRRERALDSLASGKPSLEALASRLGYRQQGSLTRAMRRWTGQTPSHLCVPSQASDEDPEA